MESRPSSQEASASSSSPVNLVNYTSTSKISPTGILLRQEKEEMQNLNDRLAAYIEQVRCLGQENRRLMIQVQTNDEITTIKNLYEKELSEARQLLDEKSKDIAKLHLDVNRTTQENQDLSNRLIKRVNELANVEKKVSFYKSRAIELQGKLSQALSEKKKQDDVNKELTADIGALTKQLSTASEKLQAESLKRIDFENRLHTSVEKMTFKSQVFENELTESKVRKQVELNELGEQLQIQFDQKLAENLHKLRRQYENQMCVKEEEIKALYDEKISDLKLINEKLLRDAEMVRDELSQIKTRSSTFQSRIHELEVHNEALSTRVKNLEKLIDDERNDHLNCIMNREHRISELQEKNGEQLKDYQDLLDIRVALDMEIAAYDKLLEGEEERLKITPLQKSASQEGRASLTRFRTPVGPRRVKSHRDYFKNMDKISPIIKDHQSAANARLEIFRQVLSAPTVRVSGGHGGVQGEDGREQLYFQQGDPISREECAIM